MTTFSALQTRVARALRDPSNKTFTAQETADFLNEGIAEISRLAPKKFVELVTLTANTLSYALAAGTSPEVEVKRVEVWNTSVTPNKSVSRLLPSSGEYVDDSQTGWEYYAGLLHVPNGVADTAVPATHKLRVWGYAPWTTADIASGSTTDVGLSNELEKALLSYCRVTGLERLVLERDLFAQWQGASNNSDVSPTSLLSGLGQAQDAWRRLSRAIAVLR